MAAAAILFATVAACGGDRAPTSTSTDSSSAPADAVADLDTFTFNYLRVPQNFDPALSNGGAQSTVLYPIYDRLMLATDDGSVEPMLAESWEYSADGLTLTLHLRSGVSFQDGEPFTAAAVKENIERTMTIDGGTSASLLESISAIEAPDEGTVVMTLSSADSTLPYTFADFAGMIMSPNSYDQAETDPVGAGAYTLEEYISGQSIKYKKWDGYWDAANIHVNNLHINIMNDSTAAFNSMQSGAADAADIAPVDIASAEAAGFIVESRQTTAFFLLRMNPKMCEAFADVKVRQAMNLAIDRDSLGEKIYMGQAVATNQFFPDSMPYYNSEIPKWEYDPERAKELLAEAGYPDGFEFEASTSTSLPDQSEAVRAMLEDVGIIMHYTIGSGTEAGAQYQQQETASLVGTWGGRFDPLSTLMQLVGDGSGQNPGDLNTDKVDTLLADAMAATDDDARNKLIQDISAEIYDQALHVATVIALGNLVYREGVEGMPAPQWSDRAYDFRNVHAAG
jgi:peptide/nickel transport system substrate-binding protein